MNNLVDKTHSHYNTIWYSHEFYCVAHCYWSSWVVSPASDKNPELRQNELLPNAPKNIANIHTEFDGKPDTGRKSHSTTLCLAFFWFAEHVLTSNRRTAASSALVHQNEKTKKLSLSHDDKLEKSNRKQRIINGKLNGWEGQSHRVRMIMSERDRVRNYKLAQVIMNNTQ